MRDDATMRDDSLSMIQENNSILSGQSRVSQQLDRCKAMLAKLEQDLAEEENEDGDFWAAKLGLARDRHSAEAREEVRQEIAEICNNQNSGEECNERRDDDLKHGSSLSNLLERDESRKTRASKPTDDKSVSSKRSIASQISKALSTSSNKSKTKEIARPESPETFVKAQGHPDHAPEPTPTPTSTATTINEPVESGPAEPQPKTAKEESKQPNDATPEATSTGDFVDRDNSARKRSSSKKRNSFMKSLVKTLSLKKMGREDKKKHSQEKHDLGKHDLGSHDFSLATIDPDMLAKGCMEDPVLSARSEEEKVEDHSDRDVSKAPLPIIVDESRDDVKLSEEFKTGAARSERPSREGTKVLDTPIDTLLGKLSKSNWSDDEASSDQRYDHGRVEAAHDSSKLPNSHVTKDEIAPSEEKHTEGAELLEGDSMRQGIKMLEENSKQIFQKFASLKSVFAEWHPDEKALPEETKDEAATSDNVVSPETKDKVTTRIDVVLPETKDEADIDLDVVSSETKDEAAMDLDVISPETKDEAAAHVSVVLPETKDEAAMDLGVISPETQCKAATDFDVVWPDTKDETATHVDVVSPEEKEEKMAAADNEEGEEKEEMTKAADIKDNENQLQNQFLQAQAAATRIMALFEVGDKLSSNGSQENLEHASEEQNQEPAGGNTTDTLGNKVTATKTSLQFKEQEDKADHRSVQEPTVQEVEGAPVPESSRTSLLGEIAKATKSTLLRQVSAGDDMEKSTKTSTKAEVTSAIKAVFTGKSKNKKADKSQGLLEESGSDPNIGPKDSEKNDETDEMLDQVTELQEINFEVPTYRQSKRLSKRLRKQDKQAKKEKKQAKKEKKMLKKLEKLEKQKLEKEKLEKEKKENEGSIDFSGLAVGVEKSDHSATVSVETESYHSVAVSVKESYHSATVGVEKNNHFAEGRDTSAGDEEQSADVLSMDTEKSEQPIDGLNVSEQTGEALDKSDGKVVNRSDRWKKQFRKTLSWSEDVEQIEEQKEAELNARAEKDVQAVIWWSTSKDAVEVMYEDEDEEKSTSSDYHSSAGGSSYDGTENSFASEPHIDFSFSTLKDALVEEVAIIKQDVREEFMETANEARTKATNFFIKEFPSTISSWFAGKKNHQLIWQYKDGKKTKSKKKTKNQSKKTKGVIVPPARNNNTVRSW